MNPTVLVAMSGGIDSAMTALLLQEQGYHVTGMHMLFFEPDAAHLQRMQRIADFLQMEILYVDARQQFRKEVIQYLVDMHSQGRTPSLCARCNPRLKWKVLLQTAHSRNTNKVATGHYIRLRKENELIRIYKGADTRKDQSYYLWGLGQEILQKVLSPLGDFTKEEVKAMALDRGLGFLVKAKESAGLCFAQGRSYEEILLEETSASHPGRQQGIVRNASGEIIGSHKGYLHYTIGQKKELQLDNSLPKLSVATIDAENNTLIVKEWPELYNHVFIIREFCFMDLSELFSGKPIQTKVRGFGLNPEGSTSFEELPDQSLKVTLEHPAWAIAKGQPAVFYSGDKLLGGGLVDQVL